MRIFGFWTILAALSISIVAAYYSIVGLVAIFAAAAIPIIIMGTVLEVGKLTSAIWLHLFWKQAPLLIKSYLTVAVLLLMFITSMGIFGFLSKAHIEQTAVATEGVAQLSRIETEIDRSRALITRAEEKITKLENADNAADEEVQRKIQAEISRIDATTARIERTVSDLQSNLVDSVAPWQSEFDTAVSQLAKLDELSAINTRDRDAVRTLQTFVKARPDGSWGTKTAARVEEFKQELESKKQTALREIQQLRTDTSTEVQRVRSIGEQEIAQANTVITRLQNQLGTTRDDDAEEKIDQHLEFIAEKNIEIDNLIEQKYEIEAEARALEAEVGPVKYIAELVYGSDAGKDTLEEAVRWVIIILVLVFDPLAVVLVIAGITLVERTHVGKPTPPTKPRKSTVKKTEKKLPPKVEPVKLVPKEEVVEAAPRQESPVEVTELEEVNVEDFDSIEGAVRYKGRIYVPEDPQYSTVIAQVKANAQAREAKTDEKNQMVNKIVAEMRSNGNWPGTGTEEGVVKKRLEEMIYDDATPELRQLIQMADEETLQEVYQEILKDGN